MAINYATGLLIVGIAAILLTQLFAKGKKGASTRKIALWIGAILVIVPGITLLMPGTIPFLEGQIDFGGAGLAAVPTTQEVAPTTPGSPLVAGQCVGIEDTTVTLSATNEYTSAATGGTHRYRLNGAPALTVSDAGTLSASPGDRIDILWFNASTSGTYVGDISSEIVPCAGTKTFTKGLYANATTVTIKLFNTDGDRIQNDVAEPIAAGQVRTIPFQIEGTYQKAHPWGAVLVTEFNKTEMDDVVVLIAGGGEKVSNPASYTGTADSTIKTYTLPPLMSVDTLSGNIVVDADDTNNPANTNITLTYYAKNYFINEDNGGAFEGPSVEDEDDAVTIYASNKVTLALE